MTATATTNPTFSFVLEHPPAEPAAAERHFLSKLAVETDPADVHLDLERGHPGIVVVDTRSPDAYARCHIPGAAAKLAALGFRVKEMIGGIGYWRKEGLPVEGSSPADAPLYA